MPESNPRTMYMQRAMLRDQVKARQVGVQVRGYFKNQRVDWKLLLRRIHTQHHSSSFSTSPGVHAWVDGVASCFLSPIYGALAMLSKSPSQSLLKEAEKCIAL